jgi:hypothetical protein
MNFVFGAPTSKTISYGAPLRCAQACGARKGFGAFRYPAFMSQPRRFAPTLAQHAGLLYSAPFGAGCSYHGLLTRTFNYTPDQRDPFSNFIDVLQF